MSVSSNFSVPSKFSKQEVIDIIRNTETSLRSLDIKNDFKNKIRERVTNNVNNFIHTKFHISKKDKKVSKNLKTTKKCFKNNPNIFFTKTDKGDVTACLEKFEYNTKMDNLLSDTPTYILVEKTSLEKLQKNTSKILKQFNDNENLKHKFYFKQIT